MQIESFATQPMADAINAYVYSQYADDSDIQGWFAAQNVIAQGYIDWFNESPFALYTSSFISGPLLDWLMNGLYGIQRPVISTTTTNFTAGLGSMPLGTTALGNQVFTQSGTVQIASDDIYKRTLTWMLYLADGKQATTEWLRRRIARFLYGANGGDVSASDVINVRISPMPYPPTAGLGSGPLGSAPLGNYQSSNGVAKKALQITVPNLGNISQQFATMFASGYLPVPFQLQYEVIIS